MLDKNCSKSFPSLVTSAPSPHVEGHGILAIPRELPASEGLTMQGNVGSFPFSIDGKSAAEFKWK